MKRFTFMILWVVLTGWSVSYAQNTYYFPQVADGSYSGGIFKTTLVLSNAGARAASINIRLTRDDGGPFSLTFSGLGAGSTFNVNLPPGNTRWYQSDGNGPLSAGAATVTSDNPIIANVIFAEYNASGRLKTEAGVGSARPLGAFTIPIDVSGLYNTGLAFFNPGGTNVQVTLRIYDTQGVPRGEGSLSLGANGHLAAFVLDFFPALPDYTQGSLSVVSTAAITTVALRTSGGEIPTLTTLPVSEPQNQYLFAQVAHLGDFYGISFKTFLIVVNPGSTTAAMNIRLTQPDGSPLTLTFIGLGAGSQFNVDLPPGHMRMYPSDGPGVGVGAATITSNSPLIVSAVYSIVDSAHRVYTETGVSGSPVFSAFTIPVDISRGFNTGVALFNPGPTNAVVTLRLYDLTGQRRAEQIITVPASYQGAGFLDDIFPPLGDFAQGSMSVISSTGIAATALRVNEDAVTYATLPVTEGAYAPGS